MKSFPSPRQETESPPLHGGDLEYASRVFGVPEQDWQDLSTGVSPWGYPLDAVPQQFWQRLPADSDPLISAAADYYGVAPSYVVPVPGSQYAIARLPQLLTYGRPSVVAVPATGYGEHARQWRRAGHGVLYYESLAHLRTRLRAKQVQHAVVINPNNPTAQWLAGDELRDLAQALPGYLVVDEAFADLNPRHSLTSLIPRRENLVILRSVGKFFGLAGIRLGFVLGAQAALIRAAIEPWAVSGPGSLGRSPGVARQRLAGAAAFAHPYSECKTAALFAGGTAGSGEGCQRRFIYHLILSPGAGRLAGTVRTFGPVRCIYPLGV